MTTRDASPTSLAEVDGATPETCSRWPRERFAGRSRSPRRSARGSGHPRDDRRAGLDIPIFTLDTGRLFPEAYDLSTAPWSATACPSRTYFPDGAAVEEMVDKHGVNLFRQSIEMRKLCCGVRKVRPLRRAQADLQAWICGLRSGQGATRQKVELSGVGRGRRARQDQPARRLGRGPCVGLRAGQRRAVQPAARPGLPQHRLRALHPCGAARRGPPLRALVVGERRAARVRPAQRGGGQAKRARDEVHALEDAHRG